MRTFKPSIALTFVLSICGLSACSDEPAEAIQTDSDVVADVQSDESDTVEDIATADTDETDVVEAEDLLNFGDPGPFLDGYVGTDSGPAPESCVDGIDNDGDEAVDCADSDCSDRLICSELLSDEVEPNPNRNDVPEENYYTLPFQVRGTIDAPAFDEEDETWTEDVDNYVFTVDGPTLIRWSYDDATSVTLPYMYLLGMDRAGGDVQFGNDHVSMRLTIDAPGAARQAYLPAAGRYAILVRDARNISHGSDEVPAGGDDFAYALSISEELLVVEAETLPLAASVAEIPEGNPVAAYDLTLPAGQVFEAEVFAQRLSPSSPFDGILHLIDQETGDPISYRDDTSTGTNDSLLRTDLLSEPRDVTLIVDAFLFAGGGYELDAHALDGSQDYEPNNPSDLAFPLRVGNVVEGQVEEPFLRGRSTILDQDYYRLPGGYAAGYHVRVEAVGDDIDVSARAGRDGYLFGPVIGDYVVANQAESRDIEFDYVNLYGGSILLEVAQRSNVFPEAGDGPLGGEGYEYELEVSEYVPGPEAVSLPFEETPSLERVGTVDWYLFSVPPRTRLEVTATPEDEESERRLTLHLGNQDYRFRRRQNTFTYYLSTFGSEFRLGVHDSALDSTYAYDLSIIAQPFDSIEELEPNDEGEDIQALGEGSAFFVFGTIVGTNQEDFDLDAFHLDLEQGERITVETFDGYDSQRDDADPIVTLEGPGLTRLEDNNSGEYWHGLLSRVEAPQTGTYTVTVRPWCDSSRCISGDYSLTLWIEDAPEVE
ncbi:MAG: hypothetical protein KC561_03745 [Myxococcales bacterium]|nr:hypothetical protein [Myxococcales bacterium]